MSYQYYYVQPGAPAQPPPQQPYPQPVYAAQPYTPAYHPTGPPPPPRPDAADTLSNAFGSLAIAPSAAAAPLPPPPRHHVAQNYVPPPPGQQQLPYQARIRPHRPAAGPAPVQWQSQQHATYAPPASQFTAIPPTAQAPAPAQAAQAPQQAYHHAPYPAPAAAASGPTQPAPYPTPGQQFTPAPAAPQHAAPPHVHAYQQPGAAYAPPAQQFTATPPAQQFVASPPAQVATAPPAHHAPAQGYQPAVAYAPPPHQVATSPPPQQYPAAPATQQYAAPPAPAQFPVSPPPHQYTASPPPQSFTASPAQPFAAPPQQPLSPSPAAVSPAHQYSVAPPIAARATTSAAVTAPQAPWQANAAAPAAYGMAVVGEIWGGPPAPGSSAAQAPAVPAAYPPTPAPTTTAAPPALPVLPHTPPPRHRLYGRTGAPSLVSEPMGYVPPMRDSGPPAPLLGYCPNPQTVDFETTWYHLPSAPDFLMCNRCHADFVAGKPLAAAFIAVTKTDVTCDFHTVRLRNILLPAGDLAAIEASVARRSRLTDCEAVERHTGGKAWTSSELGDWSACEPCYEDVLLATPWASRFTCVTAQGDWTCDLNLFAMQRVTCKLATDDDWPAFVSASKTIAANMAADKCEGKAMLAGATKWFTTRRPIDGLVICEWCYLANIWHSRFEGEFEECAVPPAVASTTQFQCDWHNSPLHSAYGLAQLIMGDFGVFWNTANTYMADQHKKQRQEQVTYYTLAGAPSNFDICGACHLGFFGALGLGNKFIPRPRNASCDLCPGQPRSVWFRLQTFEALDRGVWSHFDKLVREVCEEDLCPGRGLRKGKWYSAGPMANVCRQCWVSVGRDTPMGQSGAFQLVDSGDKERICCLTSKRMRELWKQNDLKDFTDFAKYREEVYACTIMRIDTEREIQVINAMSAMSTQLSGSILKLAGGDPWSSTKHGNNGLGWYDNATQAHGAQMVNNSTTMWANVSADIARGAATHPQLYAMWDLVE